MKKGRRRSALGLVCAAGLLAACNQAHPVWAPAAGIDMATTLLVAVGGSAGGGGGSSPTTKKTFITATTFTGNFNGSPGIAGADGRCMGDGSYPGSGTYKALIVDGTNRVACTNANCAGGTAGRVDWVLAANTTYTRSSGSPDILTTNANGVFVFGSMTNSFVGAAGFLWTGLANDWTTGTRDCSDWTVNLPPAPPANQGDVGNGNNTGGASIGAGQQNCDTTLPLICVEQ